MVPKERLVRLVNQVNQATRDLPDRTERTENPVKTEIPDLMVSKCFCAKFICSAVILSVFLQTHESIWSHFLGYGFHFERSHFNKHHTESKKFDGRSQVNKHY